MFGIGMAIGIVVGACLGILLLAILSANRDEEDQNEQSETLVGLTESDAQERAEEG